MDIARDAYVAGILDGEGSISVQKRGEVRLDVGMAEKAIPLLNWLYQIYGGSVRPTGKETDKWQARYCWTLTTDPAICLLRRVVSHMTIKREIAEAILKADLVDRDERRGQHRRWTEARFVAFETARETALRVNKKGPPETRPDWIARRVGNRWETKQGNLLTGLSETFNGSWPRAGSMRSGCVYQRPLSVPITSETDGFALLGAWPTPNTAPEAPNMSTNRGNGIHRARTSEQCLGSLSETVTALMWPTPDCNTSTYSNGHMGQNIREASCMWKTPTSAIADSGGSDVTGQREPESLASQVKSVGLWLTPHGMGSTDHTGKLGAGGEFAQQATRWSTPKAITGGANSQRELRGAGGPDLQEQVQAWPTPRATDGTKGGPNQAGSKGDLMLPSAAAQFLPVLAWPTPASRDHRSPNGQSYQDRGGESKGEQLNNFVQHHFLHPDHPTQHGQESLSAGPGLRRRLNPAFGAWLMNWPWWWTNPGITSSVKSEMVLYRSKLHTQLSFLLGEQAS
jgi:hypothetical protein